MSDGRQVLELDHPRIRGVWQTDPEGEFEQPRRPYRFDGEPTPELRPAPKLGEHDGQPAPVRRPRPEAAPGPKPLPLEGITVLDLTAWWAGPSGAALFACLGAHLLSVLPGIGPQFWHMWTRSGLEMYAGMRGGGTSPGILPALLAFIPAQLTPIIMVGCLVGLAASADRDVDVAAFRNSAHPAAGPSPSPPPRPPVLDEAPVVERHPLDPSPDDPPVEPRWKRK